MSALLRGAMLIALTSLLVPFGTAQAQGTVVASDNFDRADETPVTAGGNWERTVAGNYDGFSVLSGAAIHSASNEGIYYWHGAGTFDPTRQFARERVVQKNGEQGLVLLGGPDQAIMVGWGPPGVGSTVYIYWYSGGIDRGQLATGPSTLNNGDIIEASLEGGRIYAKVNGVAVLSVANSTTLTTGNPGFITYLDPGLPSAVSIVDDWEAGTPASFSISGTITESAAGLPGVQVNASGGFIGSAATNGSGTYTLTGVPANATGIVLTPTLSGHVMSPLSRTVTGPVTADVTGQDFASTPGGGGGGGPGVIASDDFDRADETPFAVGGNWQRAVTTGSANLTGNRVAGSSGDALYYWQGAGSFDNARQFARSRVVNPAGQVGLVLLGAANQGFVVSWNSGTLYFYWYTGGGIQPALLTAPSTLQAGDVIEAMLDGGRVYAKRNGTVVASVPNTTSLAAGTPGFETYQSGASFDDWEAGTPATYTISGTITESAAGLSGVQVNASGGFVGSASTGASGEYTIIGVPENATGIVLTPSLSGHTMSPLTRTVPGPVTADVTGEDFTSTPSGGGGPGVIASDDFNRADEIPLVVGGNWVHPFNTGSVNLTGDHVASSSGEALYYWQGAGTFSNTRQYARAHVLNAGGQVGLVLLGGPNQALVTSWGGGRLYIYWYLGGSHQGELANIAATLNDGDVIEGVLDNGVVRAKRNGVVIASVPNTTSLTNGKPGFETYLSGAVFDDWEAGTPPSFSISGAITESAVGLPGVLVTASGGFSGSTTTLGDGTYSLTGVPPDATGILLTPTLAGHVMSPLTRTVSGPVTADVAGQDFTSTANTDASLTVFAAHGSVSRDPAGTTFPLGTGVTLTPTPDAGYAFASWSGDVPAGHGTDNPLLVLMDTDRALTAHFSNPYVVASDEFDRPDETPLSVGGNWQHPFSGGSANLTSHHVAGASAEALYYWQGAGTFDDARQFSRLRVVNAAGQVGLVLLGGPNQALVVAWNLGTLYFYRYTGGSYQGNLTTVPSTLHDGDIIEADLAGGRVFAKINGVVVASVANTTGLTSGRPGFETFQAGAGFDDWEGGTLASYAIVASAGTGGTITPTGTLPVEFGASQAFVIAPDPGYAVADVLVDGGSVGAPTGYTFTNVHANHTIAASFAPVDRITAVPGPGSAITTITPCLTVPVAFSRANSTPLMGYSVTVELSPNLTLCGAQFTTAGYTQAPQQLVVAPLGGNRWSVDEVTLGTPCGAVGSGVLFTMQVSSADLTGVGMITIVATAARDCSNQPIPAFPGLVASIPIDQQGPATTTDLRAVQARTGTYVAPPAPSHSTTPIQLQFTQPGDAVAAEIYRRPFGGYPLYDDDGGSEPMLPTTLPSAGWTLVSATTSGASDEPPTRDYWYYALVTRDAYGNRSAVSNMTPGTLNYYLGDVSNGVAACAGDDHVDLADLSLLGFHYGIALPPASPVECLDVGPTTDHSPDGRPLTDHLLQFEDLVVMALNFGTVSNPIFASRTEPPAANGDAEQLAVVAPRHVAAGEIFEARVELHAGGRLHALSAALGWDAAVAAPQDVRSGGFLEASGGITFAAGPAAMDGAVLGRQQPALSGDGTFAIVKFRAAHDGDPGVHLAQAVGRDRDNRSVVLDNVASTPGAVAVSETRLLGATPAPFSSETAIGYSLAVESDVELAVFGVDGRRVRTLERGRRPVGVHLVRWDGTDDRGSALAAGMYYTRLTVGSRRFTRALVRLVR